MELEGILSISGKPGLYKMVAQGKGRIIVESLSDRKRIPISALNQVSALEDIAIYTDTEEVPLKDVFTNIAEKEQCAPCISYKEGDAKLKDYFAEILPDYDESRVYTSHIKKVLKWYNQLQEMDLISLEEETEEEKTEAKEETATEEAPANEETTGEATVVEAEESKDE